MEHATIKNTKKFKKTSLKNDLIGWHGCSSDREEKTVS
jgi:hypothetical protein